VRAKEFLRQRGVPFVERDVAADHTAAQEMVRRSGQLGVPVIAADDEVIVGFDRARLERVAARYGAKAGATPPRVGLLIKDSADGVLVGGARPGSSAERAGFRPGDVLERLDGQAVASVADVARLTAPLASRPVEAIIRRDGARARLLLRHDGQS
jgi:S1-C subfamily serine protease